ncbi:hypothetical protein C9J85_17490 [Haloferax sp. wsp5]|nr:hypothetical protein C9J85_17490 [Haloferax sp. wsp5]
MVADDGENGEREDAPRSDERGVTAPKHRTGHRTVTGHPRVDDYDRREARRRLTAAQSDGALESR